MASENVKLIRNQIDALNRGDWSGATHGVDPDVEWVVAREHPASRIVRGLDELRAYQADWRETLQDLRFEADEIVDRGDRVITTGRIAGTGAGSGAEVVVPIAFVNHFRDGVIFKVEEFLDPEEALGSS